MMFMHCQILYFCLDLLWFLFYLKPKNEESTGQATYVYGLLGPLTQELVEQGDIAGALLGLRGTELAILDSSCWLLFSNDIIVLTKTHNAC